MIDYGEPWHCVREIQDNGPDEEVTHAAVSPFPGETDPETGAPVLESPDDARLARAVACVNFLAGVPDAVLAGRGIDGALLGLLRAVLQDPQNRGARDALVDRLVEPDAHVRPAFSPRRP